MPQRGLARLGRLGQGSRAGFQAVKPANVPEPASLTQVKTRYPQPRQLAYHKKVLLILI